jgi:propionyl-CoA carboxylase beta chain
MGSKHLGADINLAWPSAQIAVMGAQGAVNILYRRELAADASQAPVLLEKYEEELLNPYIAADRGFIDAVIEPHTTRAQITKALRALANKRVDLPTRKHGNIPL